MLPPTPLSFLCALLLCLPLAIVFTIVALSTTTTTITNDDVTATTATIVLPTHITTTTSKSGVSQVTIFSRPTINNQERSNNNTTNLPLSSPPPQPPSIADEDDEQLFRLAAQVNPKPSPPRKLAFMFLTTTPLPFAPLWELYFNQTPNKFYNIYIHADPSFQYHPPFSGVFENRVIPGSKPTYRYSPTLISATRRLLSHALLHDPSNSMFALLSASCVPLHSFNFTYKTLIRSKKSFIEILKNEHGAYDRWAARGEHAMLPELPFEDFRIGSQFFVLTRKHARMVISDRRLWSKFMLPCLKKYACYPEEHYFPTLVNLKDPGGCVPATLTHVDWRGSHDGHPRTYKASEVGPDLVMAFRSDKPRYGNDGNNGSNSSVTGRHDSFLFARKFSPNSIHRLLKIALNVILKD